jgi:uncharacterized protein YbjT (DUF2867 family)
MKILLAGATGFVGARLAYALAERGHVVIAAGRRSTGRAHPRIAFVAADFERDVAAADWVPRLAGIDAVVNAVGILREQGHARFEPLHTQALFAAAATAGVRRVVQISALGADAAARSRYHLSKKAADDFLRGLPLDWVVVRPSLVYGPGGASTSLFTMLASLPFVPTPGRGEQLVQPVHVDDVVQGIVSLIEAPVAQRRDVDFVGPAPLTLREYLAELRKALGLGETRFVAIPLAALQLAARIGDWLPGSLLDTDTLAMLVRGNTGDAAALTALLQREPRGSGSLVSAAEAPAARTLARLRWLLPVLRSSIAAVWLWTGVVSLGLHPVASSYALLERVGATGAFAALLLYGAAALDLALGFATLVLRRRRRLWLVQIALIVAYTALISVRMPEFWLHPFGPLLKNLPMLAALWLLYELEPR